MGGEGENDTSECATLSSATRALRNGIGDETERCDGGILRPWCGADDVPGRRARCSSNSAWSPRCNSIVGDWRACVLRREAALDTGDPWSVCSNDEMRDGVSRVISTACSLVALKASLSEEAATLDACDVRNTCLGESDAAEAARGRVMAALRLRRAADRRGRASGWPMCRLEKLVRGDASIVGDPSVEAGADATPLIESTPVKEWAVWGSAVDRSCVAWISWTNEVSNWVTALMYSEMG